jgi:Secretion system C-terminal sorting domain/Kelch motif
MKINNRVFMKIIFLFICLSFSIYSQQVPTTLSEVYEGEIKFDFSQSSGKLIGAWEEKQSMPYPRYYGASIMYARNDTTWLYVFGGDTTSNGNATTACLRYNVNADTGWEYIDSLPTPMRVNSAVRLGDKLYTMGGFDGLPPDTAIKKFYEYDVNTQVWTELPELPEGIFFHKAIGYQDSLIYIIGGVKSDSTVFLNKVLLFNANTLQFREATPLPEQRANFAVAILNNSIIITGGYFDSDSLSKKTMIAAIDPLDHSQLTYSFGADYPIQIHSHFGYPQSNNKIDFFGGSITTGFNPTDSLYSFRIPAFVYNTGDIIPVKITAFHSGYSYTNIHPNIDSILTVIISGGIISGPFINGRTLVYKDTLTITDIGETGDSTPFGFNLKQNYPNPFNPTTVISWQLPNRSHVSLKVYDVLGNEVAELVNEEQSAGIHQINFDASGLSSGIYFYKLQAGQFAQTKKLLLMK